MSSRTLTDWLGDIIHWAERLESHVAGMTRGDFLKDAKTQDAACKCIESIGLAANEISKLVPALEVQHPDLKLSQAYKARTGGTWLTTALRVTRNCQEQPEVPPASSPLKCLARYLSNPTCAVRGEISLFSGILHRVT